MNAWLKRYARVGLALFIAVLLIAAFSGSASAAGPVYITVHQGQTLYSIANTYGVSVWALACANGLYNPNYIYAGMVLYIPYGWYGSCKPAYHPVVEKAPCCVPVQPIAFCCYYRVQWGDTLHSIAWRYHTTYWELARANGLQNPNYIYAGMNLRIPNCNLRTY